MAGYCFVDSVVEQLGDEVMIARSSVPPMYMAGRRRTGCRPSRTSMSFAVYAGVAALALAASNRSAALVGSFSPRMGLHNAPYAQSGDNY